jgi:hypothetical protein
MTHDVCGLAHAARLARRGQPAAQDEAADAELLVAFLSPEPEEDPDEDDPELDEPESDEEDDFDEPDFDESEEPESDEPEEPESADDPDFESGSAPDGSLSLLSLSFLPGPSLDEPLRLSVR